MDHLGIFQFHGNEAADAPADGNADVEETGKTGGGVFIDAMMEYQVAAGPQTCGGLQGAVTEEGNHNLLRAGDRDDLPQRQGFALPGSIYICKYFILRHDGLVAALPQRKTEKQNQGQKKGHPCFYSRRQRKIHTAAPRC